MSNSQQTIKEKASQAVQKSAAAVKANTHHSTLSAVKSLIEKDEVKKRFSEILGKKSPQFLASLTSLVSSSTSFDGVDTNSIMSSALIAATLDLPINQNLGFSYIIPYKTKDGNKAQFQMGYKGFVQLAIRSGQYKTINATEVYDGEVVSLNRLTGEIILDEEKRKSKKVVGYAAYFRLVTGFEKTLYMSVEQIAEHGRRFSKSFNSENGLWKKDFHSMALKTVIKLLLSKYGVLSVEMQEAVKFDQAVIKDNDTVEYVDTVDEPSEIPSDPTIEIITKSKEHTEGYLNLCANAKTQEALEKLRSVVRTGFEAGELTQSDYDFIDNAIKEKEKSLQ